MPADTRVELRGIALPALKPLGGYFKVAGKYDNAWSDLMIALFTPIGSRPGQRDFGSGLHLVLFEPNISTIQFVIDGIVRDVVKKWLPHVRVYGVAVATSPSDPRVVQLALRFGLSDEQGSQDRMIAIDRSSNIKLLIGA